MSELRKELEAQLARTQAGGVKRPLGVVRVGKPDDEPKTPTAALPRGAVKVK
jgi:hypothetical protein